MTRTTFKIDSKHENEFYQAVQQRFGRRRGAVENAINEAIAMWIEAKPKGGKKK